MIERFYEDVRESVESIENTLVDHLRNFLPEVQSINLVMDELDLTQFIQVGDVQINDGALTSLDFKGDGFKSLFALALLQYFAHQRYGSNLVFGIEEPESHLHSSAIYAVKSSLRELSKTFQILVTTHSPILVQRDEIKDNIVIDRVDGNDFATTARPAKNLAAIRRSLGIRPQENLTTAQVVIVVEGATEERSLPSLLARVRSQLRDPLDSGQVRVLSSLGAGNMMATIRALARDATSCIILIDSDEAGSQARQRIVMSGLVNPVDVFSVTSREGCQETEFEDAFPPTLYIDEVARACGIAANVDDFERVQRRSGSRNTRMAKWSDVMTQLATEFGQDWATLEDTAKTAFGDIIATHAENVPMENIRFIRSIAIRTEGYLREE